jgi:hypothetical protein
MRPTLPFRRTLLVATLLVIAACAGEVVAPAARSERAAAPAARAPDDAPGRGGAASSGGNANAGNTARSSAAPVSCAGRRVIQSSGRFGPAGGILVFGNSSLIIPGGALHDTVTIAATQLDDGTSTVRFAPHGLRFYKPAGLVLDGTGCDLPTRGVASVVYVDDQGTVLETIDARYDPHWKAVAAPIEHFSGYAIAFRDAR